MYIVILFSSYRCYYCLRPLTVAYGLLMRRAFQIHSTAGIFFWIKESIFYVAPYTQFLYDIFMTTLLIYIPVLIILEKKEILECFHRPILKYYLVLFG